ncbi:hypothetical protein, partial [Flavobacterium circumlabens]
MDTDTFNIPTAPYSFAENNILVSPEEDLLADQELSERVTTPGNVLLFSGQKLSEKEKYDWCLQVIVERQMPAGFTISGTFEIKEVLNEMIRSAPHLFFKIIKKEFLSEAQSDWLSRTISFRILSEAVIQSDQSKESYLRILEKFYHVLGAITIRGIAAKDMQSLLLKKLLNAAAHNNWSLISIDKIWNELIWEVVTKKGIAKKSFLTD